MILLRIGFLSLLVNASLYSACPPAPISSSTKLSYPQGQLPNFVSMLNGNERLERLPTFASWYRNFAKADCYWILRDSAEVQSIYYAAALAQTDVRNQIAKEEAETARQQLSATLEQNKLIAALLAQLASKQPLASSIAPTTNATAAAPAPSAPSKTTVFANQMPPDHKSAAK